MDKSLGTNLHLCRIFTRAKRTARQEFIYICSAISPPSLNLQRFNIVCWGGRKATHFETQKQFFFNSAFLTVLASLFATLSIFGRSDLLQILRLQAAFSFAVLCIVMFYCLVFLIWGRRCFQIR